MADSHEVVVAQRIAARFGVSPLEVLRADGMEWQVWLGLADAFDRDHPKTD